MFWTTTRHPTRSVSRGSLVFIQEITTGPPAFFLWKSLKVNNFLDEQQNHPFFHPGMSIAPGLGLLLGHRLQEFLWRTFHGFSDWVADAAYKNTLFFCGQWVFAGHAPGSPKCFDLILQDGFSLDITCMLSKHYAATSFQWEGSCVALSYRSGDTGCPATFMDLSTPWPTKGTLGWKVPSGCSDCLGHLPYQAPLGSFLACVAYHEVHFLTALFAAILDTRNPFGAWELSHLKI